jgi:methyl coenzyme M reductase beta subunit
MSLKAPFVMTIESNLSAGFTTDALKEASWNLYSCGLIAATIWRVTSARARTVSTWQGETRAIFSVQVFF